jgi:hypothetical protein
MADKWSSLAMRERGNRCRTRRELRGTAPIEHVGAPRQPLNWASNARGILVE